MANPEHLEILKQGVEAWNRWREENPEVCVDLQNADLRKVHLDNAVLSGASLNNANLVDASMIAAKLDDADLDGADLTGAELAAASLTRASLACARLDNASLAATNFHEANLARASLVNTALDDAEFDGADLVGARLDGAELEVTSFLNVAMGGTSLGNLDLEGPDFLDSVEHFAPSSIGTDTFSRSKGRIPAVFLRGCGLSDWEIKMVSLYNDELTPREFTILTEEIVRLRTNAGYCSCFISYSHSDKLFGNHLHDQLQTRGVRCWLDEHDLKPGDRILDVVNDAIRLHDKILLCCSVSSLNSWWVKDEIRKAQDRERKEGRLIIIPLNLDGYLFEWNDGLASDLTSRLAADFTGWEHDNAKFEEQFERVVTALRADEGTREKAPETKL